MIFSIFFAKSKLTLPFCKRFFIPLDSKNKIESARHLILGLVYPWGV